MTAPAPFGDRAIRFGLPQDEEGASTRRALLDDLRALSQVIDVVLCEEVGCVVVDGGPHLGAVMSAISTAVDARRRVDSSAVDVTTHVIDVVYDGEDLDVVAREVGLPRARVIELHAQAHYHVAMLGFLPGFAYLRGLPEALILPRRAPRPRVPPCSVAIAGDYSGVYPYASAGGWHLLGRAPTFAPFDHERAALSLGDRVRFAPVAHREPRARTEVAASRPTMNRPHLELTRAQGLGLLVDGGRPGRMHEGVPPGGPLVRSSLARANALVDNDVGACGLELTGTFEVTARGGSVLIADDRAMAPRRLAESESFRISTTGARARYLAIEGGVAAPTILGGRGALLVAGIGAPLRRGDLIAGDRRESQRHGAFHEAIEEDGPIAIMRGPDIVDDTFEHMQNRPFTIAPTSDRVGTRLLDSPTLRASQDRRRSTPMIRGAIELTPSGLIVLGPDHPTTGGYPVVGVVRERSMEAFFARPLGAPVSFVEG